ncbi:hypothetical protein FHG87_025228, partial [Trinorchestia longiramus]
DEECDGVVGSLSQHLLCNTKLRNTPSSTTPSVALASNGFSKQPRSLHSPEESSSIPALTTSPPSLPPRPLVNKPPPPLAPKPRPLSATVGSDASMPGTS